MTQAQHSIPVYWLDGRQSAATRSGNNAAWLCLCGREAPLVGRSDIPTAGETSVVRCPDCGREYRVVSPTRRGRPSHVQELGGGAA